MNKKEPCTNSEGCLLGAAVGDALGLPWEGLSPHRRKKFTTKINRYYFLFNRGMCSDDTEHLCLVAQSLLYAQGNLNVFRKDLAKNLRFWLLALPAGIGFATLRSIIKLWLGFSPKKSGIYSAGNGPAMRSSIIGLFYGNNPKKMHEFISASTKITHSDPKAEFGALAVAIASHLSNQKKASPTIFLQEISFFCKNFYSDIDTSEFISLMNTSVEYSQNKSLSDFITHLSLEKGITGYIYHTLPVVIFLWLKYPQDYQIAIEEIIKCGGDTDTTASILGGIIGASLKGNEIPHLQNLSEYPRNVKWIKRLAKSLSMNEKNNIPKVNFLILLMRNIFFMSIVLIHGFRRLLPPY